MCRGVEGKDALLRTAFFSIAAGAAERCIEAVLIERLFERDRLHHVGMHRRTVSERADARAHALLIDVDDQVEAKFGGAAIAKRDHLLKFPGSVHVQERERRLSRPERFLRKVQHHRAILVDGIEHRRLAELRGDFAHDVDALRLELGEMARLRSSRRRDRLMQ